MGFLEFLNNDDGKKVTNLARQSGTFNCFYEYWRDQLFERVMRLFVWEATETDNKRKSVKPKEIEQRLLLMGHCGVTTIEQSYKPEYNGLTAMFGSFFGSTQYQDEWHSYNVWCPIYADTKTIGKDIIVINNNSLRNPSYELVHHYAMLLAHVEVTLNMALINARDSGGVPVANTEKQKQSLSQYFKKLFNGQYGIVTDPGNLGLQYMGCDRHTSQDIIDIMETREKLIKSFYSDIGVRSAFEKRNNTVQAEVEADTSLLLLNLADMIDCRKRGAEAVNKMFDTNWSVHIAKEIDYSVENERVAFDTNTEIHVVDNKEDLSNGQNEESK